MRIAILHNHPIHYKHLLFTAIAALGVEVHAVFVARKSNVRTPELQPEGVTYRSHFLWQGSFEHLPQLKTAMRALTTMATCHADVVLISGYSYMAAWFVLAWAKIARKPVVLWSESNEFDHPRHWAKEAIKMFFVRGCSAGHVYGRANRQYLERLGMNPAAILEKRATVNSAVFMQGRARFHSEFRRFIYVGRFSPEKNLVRLLEAFRIDRGRHRAELVMVGYGPEEEMLRAKAHELGLDQNLIFNGAGTQEEVARALVEADCLVLPSLSETWGLVVNEAFCAGIPVIVSSRCGCAWDLVNSDTGWVIEPEDTIELAKALGEVSELTIERLQEMGNAALALAVDYTPQRCARRIVANLEGLLKNDGSGGPGVTSWPIKG